MLLHFAPLQGYADNTYRKFHAQVYGPADAYYTPFIRIEKGTPRRQDINRLESAKGDGTNLIPQVIFNSISEFITLVEAVKEKDYSHIDLNLGCPYPMQTNKGRGAAMISDMATMKAVSDYINADTSASYSIKMRVGMTDPAEWQALMPLLNDTRLEHITLHPRVSKQMYGGEMYEEQFIQFIDQSKAPVIWNGDILTIDDIGRTIGKYPQLHGIMIGRGLLARPSLVAEWRDGSEYSAERRMQLLMQLHSLIFDEYESTLCGQTQILQKIKPFWEYLEPVIGHKPYKAIYKAGSLARYRAAVESI